MKTFSEFEEYLQNEGLTARMERALIDSGWSLIENSIKMIYDTYGKEFIHSAVDWDRTKEGLRFWRNQHYKLIDWYENI